MDRFVVNTQGIPLSDEDFFRLCAQNKDLRIERTADQQIIFMPPTGFASGSRNLHLYQPFLSWHQQTQMGELADSSTGFRLPNGAIRSPDLAWVSDSALAQTSTQEREHFLPFAPDFVLELRSPSDSLPALQAKMQEYIENGTQLGWLLDPIDRQVGIYRPDQAPVYHRGFDQQLSGEPVLPGFTLDLRQLT
jgi:Uma2 family endonuclease